MQSPAAPGNVGVSGVVIGPEGRPVAVGNGGKADRVASMLPVVEIDPAVVPPPLGVAGAALELNAGAAAGALGAGAGVLAGAPPP